VQVGLNTDRLSDRAIERSIGANLGIEVRADRREVFGPARPTELVNAIILKMEQALRIQVRSLVHLDRARVECGEMPQLVRKLVIG